jgi:four helix bundle protein
MPVKDYRELEVWKRGMEIAKMVYRLTREFPREELFGLTAQSRRASVSIPSNLAEGWGRGGRREFRRFISIAQGSLKELETQLLLCSEVELTSPTSTAPILEQTAILGRQLTALRRSLQRTRNPPPQ